MAGLSLVAQQKQSQGGSFKAQDFSGGNRQALGSLRLPWRQGSV